MKILNFLGIVREENKLILDEDKALEITLNLDKFIPLLKKEINKNNFQKVELYDREIIKLCDKLDLNREKKLAINILNLIYNHTDNNQKRIFEDIFTIGEEIEKEIKKELFYFVGNHVYIYDSNEQPQKILLASNDWQGNKDPHYVTPGFGIYSKEKGNRKEYVCEKLLEQTGLKIIPSDLVLISKGKEHFDLEQSNLIQSIQLNIYKLRNIPLNAQEIVLKHQSKHDTKYFSILELNKLGRKLNFRIISRIIKDIENSNSKDKKKIVSSLNLILDNYKNHSR